MRTIFWNFSENENIDNHMDNYRMYLLNVEYFPFYQAFKEIPLFVINERPLEATGAINVLGSDNSTLKINNEI